MHPDWTPYKIGDLLDLKPGFAFKSRDFKDAGVPIIKIKNVKAGEVQLSKLSYVDPEFVETHERYRVNFGELLITLSGNRSDGSMETWVGKVAQFRLPGDYLLNQRVAVLSAKPDAEVEIDMRFMSYLLGSDSFQHLFIAIATSSGGQANLSSTQVLGADLSLPPIEEQRAIASILGALDDKIELNRRMNATLESLARAIFKSWFVDFDPVKINAGQMPASSAIPTTHDPKVLDLFPSTFQDTPLGPMPEGWRIERWGNIATLEYGKSLKGYRDSGGHIRVWGTNGPIGWHTSPLCESAGIIIGRKGAYRGVHYSPEPFFVIDTAFYLKPTCDFDLMWAYYELLRFDINGMDSGSAIPSTSRDDFYSIPVRVPPPEVLTRFGEVLEAGLAQRYANERESEILARKRDSLLPQLLSGELPVPAALTATEEALACS